MKKLIRQWLCEHKKTNMIRRILTQEDIGNPKQYKTLAGEIWLECEDCKKIINYKWKV